MCKIIGLLLFTYWMHDAFTMAYKPNLEKAIDEAIQRYGLKSEPALIQAFKHAHIDYPPREVSLLAFKKERIIELWARDQQNRWRHIQNFPLTAFSGRLGPKLRERDGQIPEGLYRLTAFNPYSSWHLSMMINYPNAFDKEQAKKEGRARLGGHIFLHGKSKSVGCLAVGDRAMDQLFILTRRVGLSRVKLIIAPNDLRRHQPATSLLGQPHWVPQLYKKITEALRIYQHYAASKQA